MNTHSSHPDIIKRLKRAGAPADLEWIAAQDSKGNIALNIVSDRD